MGIQLDWQINAEKSQLRQTEDPESRQRRRRTRRNLILGMVVVAILACVVAVGVALRWQYVQDQADSDLRAAVEAELAAIRLGDENSFMTLQRTDSQQWLSSQQSAFQEYQIFKQQGRFSPQTEIISLTIDEQRGRVVIQETLDNQPYQQVWFYWDYASSGEADTQAGWRRVPPDITFWGDENTLTEAHLTLTYYDLDADLASSLAPQLETWLKATCERVACVANLEVIIDPRATERLTWEGWQLRIISPYVLGRAPVTNPLPSTLLEEIQRGLVEQVMASASQEKLTFLFDVDFYAYDTTWLKYQIRDALVAQLKGENLPFVDGIMQLGVLPQVVSQLPDGAQINTLAPLLNPAMPNFGSMELSQISQLDWTPFFAWRLGLERTRLAQEDLNNFFALYEGGNANQAANARAFDPTYRASTPEAVLAVNFVYREDGRLLAVCDLANATQAQFIWVGDTFARIN